MSCDALTDDISKAWDNHCDGAVIFYLLNHKLLLAIFHIIGREVHTKSLISSFQHDRAQSPGWANYLYPIHEQYFIEFVKKVYWVHFYMLFPLQIFVKYCTDHIHAHNTQVHYSIFVLMCTRANEIVSSDLSALLHSHLMH